MQKDKDRRLGQAPNIPGTKWAYNNWDYNALTTIFMQETGLNVEHHADSVRAQRRVSGQATDARPSADSPSTAARTAASWAAVDAAGLDPACIATAMSAFERLPHRLCEVACPYTSSSSS